MELKQLKKKAKAFGGKNQLKKTGDPTLHGGAMRCSQIMNILNLAQPSVSHHIKSLTEAGLIKYEKDGRSNSYILSKVLLKEYAKDIATFAAK